MDKQSLQRNKKFSTERLKFFQLQDHEAPVLRATLCHSDEERWKSACGLETIWSYRRGMREKRYRRVGNERHSAYVGLLITRLGRR